VVRRLTSNKPFDFGDDPIAIRIQEFLTDFIPLRDRDWSRNFAGSAVFAEVCAF